MRSTVCAAMVLALACSAGSTRAAENKGPCDLGQNAALVYWRAFAVFPEMTKDEEQFVAPDPNLPKVDLTPEQQAGLFQRWQPVFELLREAEAIPTFDWGVNYQIEGPVAQLPYLAKGRAAARAAVFCAKYLWTAGDRKGAAEDLRTTLVLARRIGNGGKDTLIAALVQMAMEATAGGAIRQLLTDGESADVFSSVLGDLLNGSPEPLASNGVLAEKNIFVPWLRRVFANPAEAIQNIISISGNPAFHRKFQGGVVEFMSEAGIVPGLRNYPPKDVPQALDELDKQYDEIAAIYRLPFPEYLEKKSALEEQVQASKNPFSASLLPALLRARDEEERYDIRKAMIRAAIAVRHVGERALHEVTDPSDGKPFQYTALGNGAFELKSAFRSEGIQEITWTFGKAQKK